MAVIGKDFWGPSYWDVLHASAVTYTPDKAEHYVALVFAYTGLLPCEMCRSNLLRNLKKHPVDKYLQDNHTLFFWSYILHDMVNKEYNMHHPDMPAKISPPFQVVKRHWFSGLGVPCRTC